MRQIDADKLYEILENIEENAAAETENNGEDGTTRILLPVAITTREMQDLINDQPTVEAAPVAATSDCETCRQKKTCLAHIPTMCRINCPLWRGKA